MKMKIFNDIIQKNLIKDCLQGDKNSFKELISPYKNKLYNYLFRFTGSLETAEDLMQESLIKIWLGLSNYSERNSFSSWLFSIAHNTAIDYLRKEKMMFSEIEPEMIAEENRSQANPHQLLVGKETERIFLSAVRNLPLKQQDVFMLRNFAGLKFKEIAEITGEPLNTVLSHMNYSIKKIKKILSEENAA